METEWKNIKNYEGYYKVSSEGQIMSLKRKTNNQYGKEDLILKPQIINGYYRVSLHKEGECENKTVAKIVAEAFIPNPENKPTIDHINTIKTDNRVSNLRWADYSDQQNNPLTKEHHSLSATGNKNPMYGKTPWNKGKDCDYLKGKNNHNAKSVSKYTMDDIFIKKYDTMLEAAHSIGQTKSSHIKEVCDGKRNHAGGFKWKYS